AIAVASMRPIQIGRLSLLSASRRTTMGALVTGSRVSPPTLIAMHSSRFITYPYRPGTAGSNADRPASARDAVRDALARARTAGSALVQVETRRSTTR